MSELTGGRGMRWSQALTGKSRPAAGDTPSVWTIDADLAGEPARFLTVVPDAASRYPRARAGELGLEQALALADSIREVVHLDRERAVRRALVAIVDVKSQAYGRREEIAAIHQGAAMAVDAYGTARMAGHPVIALIVGHAFSGAFLAHGYQANRLLALDDEGIVIHAMHKQAAARITRRSVADLDRLGAQIPPLSYSVRDYARLGLLHELLHVDHPDEPEAAEIAYVRSRVKAAIQSARNSAPDLSSRLQSPEAREMRKATLLVRQAMKLQWAGN